MDRAGAMLPAKGQDACFMQGSWMGVADGVGGWTELGVDSGNFSRELIENCRVLAALDPQAAPKSVMADAVARCKELGSSTIVLIRQDAESSTLHAANLGDSGFMVIRDWQIVGASTPMQANYTTPLQVGHHPDIVEPQFDDPGLAETYEIGVTEGDLVVMATDGLTDFLFKDEIVRVMRKCLEHEGGTLEDCAAKLATKARARMSSSTPYFTALPENIKLDDITILVARVLARGNASMDNPKMKLLKQPFQEKPHQDEKSLDSVRMLALDDPEQSYELESGVYSLPVEQDHRHDAWFVENQQWLGVATETCGNYPAKLCRLCGKFSQKLVVSCGPFLGGEFKPKAVVVNAARKTKDKVGKTSTLLVAALIRPAGPLHAACVGDSRLLVIRDWEVIAATAQMRRRRGDPATAGVEVLVSEELHPFDEPVVVTASGFPGDDPCEVAQTLQVAVRAGDVVVCGTRGLFESLYDASIVKILRKEFAAGGSVEAAARKLVERARAAMVGATPRIKVLAENTSSRVRRDADTTVIVATVRAQPGKVQLAQ